MAWRRCATGVALLLTIELAGAAARAGGSETGAPAPFEKVRDKLSHAQAATVTAACGTAVAPWAYRGPRGDSLELKMIAHAERDQASATSLAQLLMVKADWDSIDHFHGRANLCRESRGSPYFVVAWHTGEDDVYCLFNFEARCAQVFRVNQPLGTVWFRDRADSLYAAIRGALPADSAFGAMSTPPESHATGVEQPHLGQRVWVEKLPNATVKVRPKYPMQAREEGWSGTVLVQALVGADGSIHDAIVKKSVPGLDDAALDCVWDWKFEPAEADGKPVAVWVAIPVKFTLK
jgi:TonB family protein